MAEYSERFINYHKQNPQVWELFQKFAFQAINAGRKKMGAALIFERIRWHLSIETIGDDFKMNNNYRADYARMFNEKFPEHHDFFETRERKTFDLVDANA